MKKFLGLALLASVFTTSAFASVARLEALGEDQYGSQYINDNRNMFLNAAAVNDHFDFVTFEWGDTTKVQNTESTPKAQGGIFRKTGDMVYGVYFGADSNTASQLRAGGLQAIASSTSTDVNNLAAQAQNEDTLDLFVGGETSFKWGARLSYADASNEQGGNYATGKTFDKVEKSGILVGLGAIAGNNEFYANIGAGNELKIEGITDLGGGDYHFKGELGFQVGYIRALGNNAKAWLEYRAQDVKEEEVSSLDETWEVSVYQIGYGKVSKLNDVFTANYKLVYNADKQENRGFASGQEDYEETRLTATLGMEAMVKEWLTLRASIANNLMGETTALAAGGTSKDSRTIADSTEIALGASLNFGDFAIDGLIGNNADSDGTAGETGDDNGQIRTDSLMSRVSMTYKF